MKRLAMIDGVIHPLAEARVSVTDRGFLYGDSVFETLRTYGGAVFALDRHLARLARSAALVRIDLPVPIGVIGDEVRSAVAASGNAESYVRVTITRGSGELGLDPALAGRALRVIIVIELVPPPAAAYEHGIRAVTYRVRRVAEATGVEGAKLGNYLVSVLAVRAARERGAAEALIVDAAGRIVEGATSNVFFARGNLLVTPPEEAGILPGITRALVLDAARDLGMEITFDAPLADEVSAFDEVFVSSSIREMLPVVSVDDVSVGNGKPGPAYARLLARVRERIALGGS
jgi:branched-chain amino acid aminotransferase